MHEPVHALDQPAPAAAVKQERAEAMSSAPERNCFIFTLQARFRLPLPAAVRLKRPGALRAGDVHGDLELVHEHDLAVQRLGRGTPSAGRP